MRQHLLQIRLAVCAHLLHVRVLGHRSKIGLDALDLCQQVFPVDDLGGLADQREVHDGSAVRNRERVTRHVRRELEQLGRRRDVLLRQQPVWALWFSQLPVSVLS